MSTTTKVIQQKSLDATILLSLVRMSSRDGEVNYVKPRKYSGQDRPKNGAISIPGADDGDRRPKPYPSLSDLSYFSD
jgi:hypothetical protein